MRKGHKNRMTPPTIRRLATHLLVHSSLIFSSMPLKANEQVQNPGLGTAVQLINTAGQLYMQYLQSQPQPGPCDSLNPAAEIIPSQYFPGCPVFKAQGAFPEGACEQIKDLQTFGQGESCRAKSIQYTQTLDNLLSEAQNTSNPKGVQCLEASRKNVMTSIEDRLNNLRAMANRIKKETQMFKEQNKAMLDEMSNVAQELYGASAGDEKVGMNERTSQKGARDFSKYFGASCKNIIGNSVLTSSSNGLVGIQDGMKETHSKALDYNQNKTSYQRDLNKKIAEIQDEVSKRGIGPWLGPWIAAINSGGKSTAGLSSSGFASVDAKMGKEIMNFVSDYNRLRSEVTGVLGSGNDIFELPDVSSLSKNFTADMQEFRSGAKVFFKKKYINQCVTMADKGVGLTTDQILKALEYPATGGFGDALSKYKLALQNILDSDIYMDEKLIRIRALDQQFAGGVVVSYQDSNAGYVKEPPFALFQKTVAACEAKYNEDDTFSPTDSSGVGSESKSMAKKIDMAEEKIKEIENMSRTFISSLMQDMSDELNNCSGRDYKAETCDKDGGILSPQSEGFCIAHASKCSEQTSSCYLQADKLISERKNNLSAKAKVYNTNVANLVARQEAILTQMRDQVLADAEFLKKYFPGSTWEFPKDLFIKMPEEAMNEKFGVKIRGDLNLAFLDDLPRQIEETLVKTLEDQRTKVDGEIQNYIAQQRSAMEENRNKWQQLRSTCESSMKSFEAQYAQQMAQQQKAAEEANQQKLENCSKVDKILSSNPLGLCGKPGDLFEDSSRIAASLDAESADLVNQASALCDEAQSEGIVGTEKDDDDDDKESKSSGINIASVCKIKKEGTKKYLIDQFAGTFPEGQRSKIKSYLNSSDGDTSLLSGVDDSIQIEVEEFRSMINPKDVASNLDQLIQSVEKATDQESKDRKTEVQKIALEKAGLSADMAVSSADLDAYKQNKSRFDNLSYCDQLKLNAVVETVNKSYVSKTVEPKPAEIQKSYDEIMDSLGENLGGPISRSVANSKAKDLEESFSRLGENYNGACNGDSNIGRNNFLQNFDASILGAGGLNGLSPVIGK